MDQKIKKRYESLCKRDFNYRLEVYLFQRFLENKSISNISVEDFRKFELKPEWINKYRRALQLSTTEKSDGIEICIIDEFIENWYKDNNTNVYFQKYKEDIFSSILSESAFEIIFHRIGEGRKCHYCGISEEDIKSLIKMSENEHNAENAIHTKRLLTRGRTMEIDRINPFGGYDNENIILACYWCNNAKTDEFSYDEFKDNIAPAIQTIWEKRLNKKLNPPNRKK